MIKNPVTYEILCDILVQNPHINSLRPLINKSSKLGFDGFKYADAWMALGWMRQFRIVKEPIFFKQTNKGLELIFKGFNNATT